MHFKNCSSSYVSPSDAEREKLNFYEYKRASKEELQILHGLY